MNLESVFRLTSKLIQPLLYTKLFNADLINNFWLKLKLHSGTSSLNFSNASTYASLLSYLSFEKEYIYDAWKSWSHNEAAMYYDLLTDNSDLRCRLFSAMKTRLVDEMLTKVDRMTMAHSLEARVPFLDHVFVEHCVSLPDTAKIHKNRNGSIYSKYFLRLVSEEILPHEIVHRENHGFDMPIDIWIRSYLDKIADITINGVLVSNNLLNRNKFMKILSQHRTNTQNNAMFILNIFAFESWHKAYKSNIPGFNMTF